MNYLMDKLIDDCGVRGGVTTTHPLVFSVQCSQIKPEKAQYSQEAVRSLCGADYPGTIGLVTDKYKAIGEMIDYCKEYNIYSYSDLLEYCRGQRHKPPEALQAIHSV